MTSKVGPRTEKVYAPDTVVFECVLGKQLNYLYIVFSYCIKFIELIFPAFINRK